MQTQSKVLQINPDQARIDAAVKLAKETATLGERKRYLAISALSRPGLEAQVQAALESGASAGDTALAIMTALTDAADTVAGAATVAVNAAASVTDADTALAIMTKGAQ